MVIAVDADNRLYVRDWGNARIQICAIGIEYLDSWDLSEKGEGQLFTPTSVKVDSESNAWVVGQGNSRVQKFIRVGEFLTTWGVAGDYQGQFGVPTSIALDSDENFYVSEVENARAQIFSSEGEYVSDLLRRHFLIPTAWLSTEMGTFTWPIPEKHFIKKFSLAD